VLQLQVAIRQPIDKLEQLSSSLNLGRCLWICECCTCCSAELLLSKSFPSDPLFRSPLAGYSRGYAEPISEQQASVWSLYLGTPDPVVMHISLGLADCVIWVSQVFAKQRVAESKTRATEQPSKRATSEAEAPKSTHTMSFGICKIQIQMYLPVDFWVPALLFRHTPGHTHKRTSRRWVCMCVCKKDALWKVLSLLARTKVLETKKKDEIKTKLFLYHYWIFLSLNLMLGVLCYVLFGSVRLVWAPAYNRTPDLELRPPAHLR